MESNSREELGMTFTCGGSVDYFTQEGRTQQDHDHTRLTMVPIGLGIKYIVPSPNICNPYLGIGANATYLNIHTHSEYLMHDLSQWGFGGIAKMGCIVDLTHSWILDLFINYTWVIVHPEHCHGKYVVIHDANLSGLSVGGAIGYRF